MGLGLGQAALIAVQASLLAAIITGVFLHGAGLREVTLSLLALALVAAGRAALAGAAGLTGHLCSAEIKSRLRADLMDRSLAGGPAHLAGQRRGELATTVSQGVDALDGYYAGYLPQLALGALVPAMLVGWTLHVDPVSAAILAVTVPLVPVFMWLVGVAADRRARRRWRTLSLLSAYLLDVVSGLPTLKIFGRSRAVGDSIATVTERYRRAAMSTLRLAFLSALVLELAASVSTALVAVGVGLRLVAGELDLQAGLTVLLLVPEVYLPLRRVGAAFHGSAEAGAAAERIFALVDVPAAAAAPGIVPAQGPLPVRLEDVSFSHPGRPEPVLAGVCLEIRPGERVALVGPSGSGKSTLLALLLGFTRPDSGRLLVGDADLRRLDLDAWRRRVGWLPQLPYLFKGSIADNIRLGEPRASTDAVRAALAQAGLGDFIASLPDGVDTRVGERGSQLSGGQRTRLALARVLVRPCSLLLLDEPGANLDADAARLVGDVLETLPSDRSVLYVTHDLELARRAGRVLTLEHGRLQEALAPATVE